MQDLLFIVRSDVRVEMEHKITHTSDPCRGGLQARTYTVAYERAVMVHVYDTPPTAGGGKSNQFRHTEQIREETTRVHNARLPTAPKQQRYLSNIWVHHDWQRLKGHIHQF
eukprot:1144125-Pelagomonas_calceolata.AAC.6